jgi:Bacterial extracellular solute-binding proteins, family 5 Middle
VASLPLPKSLYRHVTGAVLIPSRARKQAVKRLLIRHARRLFYPGVGFSPRGTLVPPGARSKDCRASHFLSAHSALSAPHREVLRITGKMPRHLCLLPFSAFPPRLRVSALKASRALGILLLLALTAFPATRPHYGGALRVEIRESIETADPPQSGYNLSELNRAFSITQWQAGGRAVYTADENAPGGRPFLDTVDIQMGRPLREQGFDLELGKADIVQLDPAEARRSGHRVWSSSPVRLLAVVFSPHIADTRVREALALAVDRGAIHNVLLQRQGEITAALLPQWLSGWAFVFPAAQDVARARSLVAALPAASRSFTLAAADPANRRIADRIALNARDAGLVVTSGATNADARLIEVRITSADPARALAGIAAALALPEPPRADSPEALYTAERALLEGFRVIPLFYLPDVYGVGPRVRGGPGITPLGEWRFENLWLENARP